MAGGKETPRQKMIGMMYLVLMAMLAMNVSKEVLNSFIVIDEALSKTNDGFVKKINNTVSSIEFQYQLDKKKVEKIYKASQKIQKVSDDMANYVNRLKREVIYFTQGSYAGEWGAIESVPDSMWQIGNFPAKDDYDKPTFMLIGDEPGAPKEGEYTAVELRQKLENFKKELGSVIDPKSNVNVDDLVSFDKVKQEDGSYESWEAGNFYHIPIAAIATNLTRMEADVRNAEAVVLNELLKGIGQNDFKFDEIDVKVMPKSNYVVLGDSFKADVIVAAYSTTQPLQLEVGNDIDTTGKRADWKVVNQVPEDRIKSAAGVASYGYKPTSEGEVNWGGFVTLTKPDGTKEKYPFKSSFIAAKPSAVISATKMNVFYRGLDNPLSVSVSGFANDKVNVNVTNGSLSGSSGNYKVKPGKGKECKVNVSVKMSDGSSKSMGEQVFRVKNVPKPEPEFARVTPTNGRGDKVKTAEIKIANKVKANMGDFLFDGVKFKVVSFELIAYNRGKAVQLRSSSDRITTPMRNLLNTQRKGSRIFIQNVFAIGPSGKKRNLGNINMRIR